MTWKKYETKIRVGRQGFAKQSLEQIETVLNELIENRSLVAAVSNRVDQATQSNRDQITLGITAEARIRDADFASTTSELTRVQIVSQASISLMSQAQDMRKVALQLL